MENLLPSLFQLLAAKRKLDVLSTVLLPTLGTSSLKGDKEIWHKIDSFPTLLVAFTLVNM